MLKIYTGILSVPQNKILIDTNVYLRLAQSIRPFLRTTFGNDNTTFYVLPDMDDEYNRNPRLKSSFSWFTDQEYSLNRKGTLTVSKKQMIEIDETVKFFKETSAAVAPGVSTVDIKCLAYGYVLGIPVATDDKDMIILAEEYKIRTLKTLDVLKLMLDSQFINMNKIREIVEYIIYKDDLPAGFKADFKRIFKEEIPGTL